jgi:hypothetical protein
MESGKALEFTLAALEKEFGKGVIFITTERRNT